MYETGRDHTLKRYEHAILSRAGRGDADHALVGAADGSAYGARSAAAGPRAVGPIRAVGPGRPAGPVRAAAQSAAAAERRPAAAP
jgi:hypothetical protein